MLRARITEDGTQVEHVLTTAVTVERPDLIAGNLEVNGTTRVIGAGTAITAPKPGESLNYEAETDGTVLGKFPSGFTFADLRASALMVGNGKTVELTWNGSPGTRAVVRITAGSRRAEFTSDNSDMSRPPTENALDVPIAAGDRILVRWTATAGSELGLTWLPKGSGAPTEVA
ncbi:hypothetical protein ACFZBU_12605 [Embleya sp. NPDC008237]|uniref:hypothetical protein n=1 Tax=Embleya sp. NPDC008237 TaxID=3363978 RepID=UPI0036E42873